MNHEDGCFCELAPLYTLDLLNPQERQWVEQQVTSSPELAAELAELQATVGAIAYAAPPLPVAADLKDRLFQRLSQPAERSVTVAPAWRDRPPARLPTARVRTRNYPLWLPLGGAIAALALVALGVENDRLRQSAKNNSAVIETLQQADAIVHTLRGTEKAATASGHLVVSPRQNSIAILAQDLPQLPSGQVYRLWAMPQNATKPTYCGQFNGFNKTSIRWAVPEATCRAPTAQMLITAELATDPLIPAGSLIMKSVL